MKRIMFNHKFGLTRAVLDGRKTMTRRIIPPIEIDWARRGKIKPPISGYKDGVLWMDLRQVLPDSSPFDYVAPKKYQSRYDVGEKIAIAMSYEDAYAYATGDIDIYTWIDMVERANGGIDYRLLAGRDNKMFTKADLMPFQICIKGIKVERLQDISNEDAMREGVFMYEEPPFCHEYDRYAPWPPYVRPYKYEYSNLRYFGEARFAFAHLIDRISGRGTWNSNPLVYAYDFELVKLN
ncbi:MAG: hypothetical protein IKX61_02440 [Prevotella sp.]|nr:hypothetical protein [Prevotella sp.]